MESCIWIGPHNHTPVVRRPFLEDTLLALSRTLLLSNTACFFLSDPPWCEPLAAPGLDSHAPDGMMAIVPPAARALSLSAPFVLTSLTPFFRNNLLPCYGCQSVLATELCA